MSVSVETKDDGTNSQVTHERFLHAWMALITSVDDSHELILLQERPDARELVSEGVTKAIQDHLGELKVLERMGSHRAALAYIRNQLPVDKLFRSGDFVDFIGSEFIDRLTDFRIPIKKSSW